MLHLLRLSFPFGFVTIVLFLDILSYICITIDLGGLSPNFASVCHLSFPSPTPPSLGTWTKANHTALREIK
jgi:hypothetical protein